MKDIKLLPILAEGYFIKQSFVPNTKCYEWYHKMKYYKACFVLLNIKPYVVSLGHNIRRYSYDTSELYRYLYDTLTEIIKNKYNNDNCN